MTRYRSFVLSNVKYYSGDFVYVYNDKSVEGQEATSEGPQYPGVRELEDCWVAKILEIRALDEYHVYARIYWMYSPDELPQNMHDNERMVSGRQPYHGQNELIASNHMDVINVVSVAMRAVVRHCEGCDDGPTLHALHWRQALDCHTLQLSSVDKTRKHINGPKLDESTVELYTTHDRALAFEAAPSQSDDESARRPLSDRGREIDDSVQSQINIDTPRTSALVAREPLFALAGNVTRSCTNGTYADGIDGNSQLSVEPGELHERLPSLYPAPGVTSMAPTCRPYGTATPAAPAYLPSTTQHQLLVHLQHILELTCYEFGTRVMPDTLRQRGWDCAESVELNRWIGEFLKRQKMLFTRTESIQKPLHELLRSVSNIRHCAVHRRRVSTKGLGQFLLDAEALSTLLGDVGRSREIAMLRKKTQATMDELEHNTQHLRLKLDETLRDTAAQRVQLRSTEDTAIAETERLEATFKILAGKVVEDAIRDAP